MLSVPGWEGTLDWLLELASSRRLNLARLSIVALVEAFSDALDAALERRGADAVPLGTMGDWIVMAASLTLLRSRLLLPPDDAAAKQAHLEAEALRRQLIDRSATLAAADWLERRDKLGREVFARGRSGAEEPTAGRAGDITSLLRACLVALQLPWDADSVYRVAPLPLWTVARAIARMREMLPIVAEGSGLEVFLPRVPEGVPDRELRCRAALAATFCAGLELARDGAVVLVQAEQWGSVSTSVQAQPGCTV